MLPSRLVEQHRARAVFVEVTVEDGHELGVERDDVDLFVERG